MTEELSTDRPASKPVDNAAVSAGFTESPPVATSPLTTFPYGPVASIVWVIVLITVMGAAESAVATALQAGWGFLGKSDGKPIEGPSEGLLISVATLVGAASLVALVILLAAARRYPLRDYLALAFPTPRQTGLAVGGLIVFMATSYGTSYMLRDPLEPMMIVEAYRTGAHFLMFVAVVFAAAVGEEVLFRGFLFKGIASSSWGPVAAIVVSAAFWAVLHFSFGVRAVVAIAILGLYLGAVRFKTGSLPLTMLLHGLNNAVGYGVVALLAQRAA